MFRLHVPSRTKVLPQFLPPSMQVLLIIIIVCCYKKCRYIINNINSAIIGVLLVMAHASRALDPTTSPYDAAVELWLGMLMSILFTTPFFAVLRVRTHSSCFVAG